VAQFRESSSVSSSRWLDADLPEFPNRPLAEDKNQLTAALAVAKRIKETI
jgi:hypothetical protein